MSRVEGHPTGCTCAHCPPRPKRIPDVEPGTPEHAAWMIEQQALNEAAEARAKETEHNRPQHWGIGKHLSGKPR